jgi:hypothetical protein
MIKLQLISSVSGAWDVEKTLHGWEAAHEYFVCAVDARVDGYGAGKDFNALIYEIKWGEKNDNETQK